MKILAWIRTDRLSFLIITLIARNSSDNKRDFNFSQPLRSLQCYKSYNIIFN